MTECRNCHREITHEVRTYSCFPSVCADCADRMLGVPAGWVDGTTPVHRVTLRPEQIAEVEQRSRDRAELEQLRTDATILVIDEFNHVEHDPLWAPIERHDYLLIMQTLGAIFPTLAPQLESLELTLRRRWKKPEREPVEAHVDG
jgi:hypothetical protein